MDLTNHARKAPGHTAKLVRDVARPTAVPALATAVSALPGRHGATLQVVFCACCVLRVAGVGVGVWVFAVTPGPSGIE